VVVDEPVIAKVSRAEDGKQHPTDAGHEPDGLDQGMRGGLQSMKKRWRFAWPCVSALALCGVACTTQRAADTVKVPRSAQEILSRPDRAHEER